MMHGQTQIKFTWKLQRKLNVITSYYLAQLLRYEYATSVRPAPHKNKVVNCFPSFLITWIISSSPIPGFQPSSFSFFKCWHLSAIWRTVFPLNSCWKEDISFILTKRVLIVVLITGHYTYNCIKLMHNKEVECVWNVMAHVQKPDFVFRRNGRVHLNQRGRHFSWLLAAELCASALVMLDIPCSEAVWEYWLPTPFAIFPFTSPPMRRGVPSGFKRTLFYTNFPFCLLYLHNKAGSVRIM